jgi:hypothetical protein
MGYRFVDCEVVTFSETGWLYPLVQLLCGCGYGRKPFSERNRA